MADIQRQTLNCTNCRIQFRFDMDFELDGNHEITCPGCGHVHYRVVVNGKITEERFNQNPAFQTFYSTNYYISSTSSTSTDDTNYIGTGGTTAGTGDMFIRNSWVNTTGTS